MFRALGQITAYDFTEEQKEGKQEDPASDRFRDRRSSSPSPMPRFPGRFSIYDAGEISAPDTPKARFL